MRTISKVAYVDYDNFYVAELEKIRERKNKMKQIKKLLLLSIVLVLSLTLTACKEVSKGDLAVQTLLDLIDRFGETKSFDNDFEYEMEDSYFVTNGNGAMVIGDELF